MSIPKWIDIKETSVMNHFNEKIYVLFHDGKEGHICIGFDDNIYCAINFANSAFEEEHNIEIAEAAAVVEKLSKGGIPSDVFTVMFNLVRRLAGAAPRLHVTNNGNLFLLTERHTVIFNKEEMTALEYVKENNSFH